MITTATYIVLLFNMEEGFDVLEGSTTTVLGAELTRGGVNTGNKQEGGWICQAGQAK
jgi:hypothetical protein